MMIGWAEKTIVVWMTLPIILFLGCIRTFPKNEGDNTNLSVPDSAFSDDDNAVLDIPTDALGDDDDAGDAVLDIPADVLGEDTTVTVTAENPPDSLPDGDILLGDVSCDFTACGGNVVGGWSLYFMLSCDDGIGNQWFEEYPECDNATVSQDYLENFVFNHDNTYTITNPILERVYALPPACLNAIFEGDLTACNEIDNASMRGAIYCTGNWSETGCSCVEVLPRVSASNVTGNWSTSGNLLTIVPDGSDSRARTSNYCVSGDELRMLFQGNNSGESSVMILKSR